MTVLLSACSAPPEISISVDQASAPLWSDLVAAEPLPEPWVIAEETDAELPSLTVRSFTGPLAGEGRVIRSEWLAPTRAIWEPAGTGDPGAIVPINEIDLPRVAESVDGLYVNDQAYPLVVQTVATLALPGPDSLVDDYRDAIEAWFGRLPNQRTPPSLSWIGGVGDIMLERGVTGLLDRSDGLEVVFGDVLGELQAVDFLLGNLEGAVTTGGDEWPKTFTFRFHPRVLPRLAEAGFDYLSVVNNHSYDFGESGFVDTLRHLRESALATSGAGMTPAEAAVPYEVVLDGARVRVLSVGAYPVERSGFDGARHATVTETRPGTLWAEDRNPSAKEFALAAMAESFGSDTYDIVMVHGGAEWATAPSAAQRRLYKQYVDAGADLVLGHHSHVTQGLEAYSGALIAYSLGNFVFPGMFLTEFGEESKLVRVGIADGSIRYLELVPVRIDHQTISLDRDPQALDRIYRATERLRTP